MTTVWIFHSYIQFTIGFWFSENIEKSSYLGNKFINLLYSCNLHSFSLFLLNSNSLHSISFFLHAAFFSSLCFIKRQERCRFLAAAEFNLSQSCKFNFRNLKLKTERLIGSVWKERKRAGCFQTSVSVWNQIQKQKNEWMSESRRQLHSASAN